MLGNMPLDELVGQHLMIGISGTKLTPEVLKLFQDTHAGGLIVFRPNFESAKAFKKLICDLENALGRRLLVAVDHEGGRVIHLAEGITVFPDNLALGTTKNEAYARKQGEIEGKELRRLGIDLNLSPTLDVLTENFSPNIGIRSYGKDPDLVARLGSARIKAMQSQGLSACAKHFPGQGHSSIDSHLGLPVLNTTWDEMRQIHIKPFVEAIKAGVDTIMSSHPVYPNLDPARVPATFSKKLIKECLRGELGFQGVVLSDDLEMGALKNLCPMDVSAVKAIEAGHDVVLVCHDADGAREVYKTVLEAYQKGKLNVKDLEASVQRVNQLKKDRLKDGDVFPEGEGRSLAQSIARDAISAVSGFDKPVSVIFPRLSSLSEKIFVENEMIDEAAYVKKIFNGSAEKVLIVGIDPTDHELEEARALLISSRSVAFFCFDAHLYPQTRKLLDLVQGSGKQSIIILLRDPYDREFVRNHVICVDAFGFRACQIQAALDTLVHS